jgi:negative regulator of flagellin synthesis FlgM
MAIEINNVTTTPSQLSEAAAQERPAPQPAPEKSGTAQPQTADQVSLTPTAQQLRDLEQRIADQPVVDAQKVTAVKEALASGSFEVDPSRIAGKMMSLEKALGDMS